MGAKKKGRGAIRGLLLFRRIRLRWRSEAVDHRRELGVRRWSEHLERLRHVGNPTVRAHHEQRAVVPLVLGVVRAVELSHFAAGVAGEHDRKVLLAGPRCQCGVGIDAYSDYRDVAAVVEERGVLITVRLHLDRSAFGSRLIKECEYHCAATEVREPNRSLE